SLRSINQSIIMPPVPEDTKVLAGHMPAEKVGGMRVVRKDRRHSENENRTPSEGGSDSDKSEEFKQAENVLAHTGLAAQTNKDYPDAAVRHYHEKTVPRNQQHNVQPHCPRSSGPLFQPPRN
ncbi:hypothetical protein PFISCL1PPCAC_29107, partial [Pristionchus fissidentatus]